MTEQKLTKILDIVEQMILALKFYLVTKDTKYFDELTWALKRMQQQIDWEDKLK